MNDKAIDTQQISEMMAYARRAESTTGRDLSEAVAEHMLEFAMVTEPEAAINLLPKTCKNCQTTDPILQEKIDNKTRLDISASIIDKGSTFVGSLVLELKTASRLEADQAERQISYLLDGPGTHCIYFICRENAKATTTKRVKQALATFRKNLKCHKSKKGWTITNRKKNSTVRVRVQTWDQLATGFASSSRLFAVTAGFAEASAHPFLPASDKIHLDSATLGDQLDADVKLLRQVLTGTLGRKETSQMCLQPAKMMHLHLAAGVNSTEGLFGVELDPFARTAGSPYWLTHAAGNNSIYHIIDPATTGLLPTKYSAANASDFGPLTKPVDYRWQEMQALWRILQDVRLRVEADDIGAKTSTGAAGNRFTVSFRKDDRTFTLVLDVDRWKNEGCQPVHIDACSSTAPCAVCTTNNKHRLSAKQYRKLLVSEAEKALKPPPR